MSTEMLVGFGIALAIVVFQVVFSEQRVIERRLRSAKLWSLAELPEDTVGRVTGRVRVLGEPLISPLTGRACVYCVIRVVDTMHGGNRTTRTETYCVPFVLEDATGRAVVDPERARAALPFGAEGTIARFEPPPPGQMDLLQRHTELSAGHKPLLFAEAAIEAGQLISVLGAGTREPDPEAAPTAYRDAGPTRLRLTSSARRPLVIGRT